MVIALDGQGKAVAKEMRWGFVPSWAIHKAKAFKRRANVRADPLDSMFKSPLQKRRCLIPADGECRSGKNSGKTSSSRTIFS